MSSRRASIERWRGIDLRVVDLVLAAGLTVGAVIDARHAVPDAFDVATVLSCVVCAGSVAWRRFRPALACVAACSGYVALAVISGYDSAGVFEWLPVGLTFYTLGRWGVRSDVTPVVLGLFAGWLLGAVLIYYVPTSGSVAGVLALWASAIVPFAVGRVFAARSALIGELTTRAAQLEREQDLGARRAVVEERSRIARELHDIVAHCVSVMVVQTVGARTVAQQDLALARGALKVVESTGREALVELRRTVGVYAATATRLPAQQHLGCRSWARWSIARVRRACRSSSMWLGAEPSCRRRSS